MDDEPGEDPGGRRRGGGAGGGAADAPAADVGSPPDVPREELERLAREAIKKFKSMG